MSDNPAVDIILRSGFGPARVAGLAVWFKADSGTFQNAARSTVADPTLGDPVGGLVDQSRNGNHASQSTDANRPSLALVSGRPVLRFNGSTTYLQTAAFTLIAQPTTIFCVASFATNATQRACDGINGSFRQVIGYQGGGVFVYSLGSLISETVALPVPASVITGQFNGASSINRRNGTQVATGNSGVSGITGVGLGIDTNLSSGWLNGDIYEYLLYRGLLSATQMLQIERYLGNRHGIVVA